MAKPWIHAESSARKFGGKPEDYIDIHNLLDSSKSVVSDNRHRFLTHNSWFLFILEKIFGTVRQNSAGRTYSVRDIGEQHILEDFGGKYIPTPQDYAESMTYEDWMQNGHGHPPSFKKIEERRINKLPKKIEDVTVDGSRKWIDHPVEPVIIPEPADAPKFRWPPQTLD